MITNSQGNSRRIAAASAMALLLAACSTTLSANGSDTAMREPEPRETTVVERSLATRGWREA